LLTADQRDEFERRGLLRLPEALPPHDAERMRDQVWDHLRQTHGARADRPATWPAGAMAHFQALIRTRAFDALASPAVLEAFDALLGRDGWQAPEQWGRPLVTFPEGSPWQLPSRGWHRDSSDRAGDPVLVVFAVLAPLRPQGGGTLVVTGSHRLTPPDGRYAGLRSAQVRDRLAAERPWFRDVCTPGAEPQRTARLLGSTHVADGVPLEVRELTGGTGDVFLMHPRSLHAVAPNALDAPRLMLLHFVQGQADQSARPRPGS
jgi:ectoine hydroxylase-related dioxygenase (phytanoyl-CoA dioxygenase family)